MRINLTKKQIKLLRIAAKSFYLSDRDYIKDEGEFLSDGMIVNSETLKEWRKILKKLSKKS